MDQRIKQAALLYATDRQKFNQIEDADIYKAFLDMLFLNASTRPDLAEYIPLWLLGHTVNTTKHGYDGGRSDNKPIECKIRTATTPVLRKGTSAKFTANDVSEGIIAKYDADDPEFLISFFTDGHLLATWSTQWESLRARYSDALFANGRRCTDVNYLVWGAEATLEYINTSQMHLFPLTFNSNMLNYMLEDHMPAIDKAYLAHIKRVTKEYLNA